MKGLKFFSILLVVGILCVPAALHAKGPKISFSFNIVESLSPRTPFLVPPPPPPVAVPVLVPVYPAVPPAYVERQTIVKEYHYQYPAFYPECRAKEIHPLCPYCQR